MSEDRILLDPLLPALKVPESGGSPSLAKFFFDPKMFFKALDIRPGWVKAFMIASAIMMLTIVISIPLLIHTATQQLPNMSPDRQQELISTLRVSQYIGILFSPVVFLLKISIGAYVLWVLSIFCGADLPFRKVLSLVSYVSIIPVLDRLAGYSLNYLSNVDSIENAEQIRSTFLSVSSFVNLSGHPALRALADNCDLFALWYLTLLVIGLAVIGRFSQAKSTGIVSIFFFIQLIFALGTSVLFTKGV